MACTVCYFISEINYGSAGLHVYADIHALNNNICRGVVLGPFDVAASEAQLQNDINDAVAAEALAQCGQVTGPGDVVRNVR